ARGCYRRTLDARVDAELRVPPDGRPRPSRPRAPPRPLVAAGSRELLRARGRGGVAALPGAARAVGSLSVRGSDVLRNGGERLRAYAGRHRWARAGRPRRRAASARTAGAGRARDGAARAPGAPGRRGPAARRRGGAVPGGAARAVGPAGGAGPAGRAPGARAGRVDAEGHDAPRTGTRRVVV